MSFTKSFCSHPSSENSSITQPVNTLQHGSHPPSWANQPLLINCWTVGDWARCGLSFAEFIGVGGAIRAIHHLWVLCHLVLCLPVLSFFSFCTSGTEFTCQQSRALHCWVTHITVLLHIMFALGGIPFTCIYLEISYSTWVSSCFEMPKICSFVSVPPSPCTWASILPHVSYWGCWVACLSTSFSSSHNGDKDKICAFYPPLSCSVK
jgi:hypothetical protein